MPVPLATAFFMAYGFLLAAAAVVDARSRRFPNAMALALAALGMLVSYLSQGLHGFLSNAVAAAFAVVMLVGFEMGWRRSHYGAAGMGMGDIKALGCLMVVSPPLGMVSFAAGLLLLALGGMASGRASLPLLPFMVPVFLLLVPLAS